jgi:hypothetical protein
MLVSCAAVRGRKSCFDLGELLRRGELRPDQFDVRDCTGKLPLNTAVPDISAPHQIFNDTNASFLNIIVNPSFNGGALNPQSHVVRRGAKSIAAIPEPATVMLLSLAATVSFLLEGRVVSRFQQLVNV